jgi:glycosyltransferase involved in cell wall biosynthesis
MKTTGPKEWKQNNRVTRNKNVILDGRKLSSKALIELYHSAHCFLFPTRGEGFGLTLAEAMRTGLPCISPYYSGLTDFFNNKVGYVIDYKMGEGKVTFMGDNTEEETEICFPSPEQLAEKMVHVLDHYQEALKLGKKAHLRIKKFTWKRSAYKLINTLQKADAIDDQL